MTQVKDNKYFNALFRFDSLNRQMFFRLLKAVETFSCVHRFGLAAFFVVSLTMDWTVGSSLCKFNHFV